MRSGFALAFSLAAGAAAGALLMMGSQGVFSAEDTQPTSTPTSARPVLTTSSTVEVKPTPPSDQVMLAWTPGGLPDGFSDLVAAMPGVEAVTSVRSDLAHVVQSLTPHGDLVLAREEGFVIPIEMMAFDTATFPAFVPKQHAATFQNLGADEILLGTTSARLRGLGTGGSLRFESGSTLTVAAVVDDVLIGAAEAAVPLGGAEATGIATERYLLIRYSGSRKDLETAVRAALPPEVPVRIRAPGETPVFRQGDAVLPQVLIKERFGEFAYRLGEGVGFEIEPAWVEANIVAVDVPLLGTVRCHRVFAPSLAGAMNELAERNLAFLVDPEGSGGCWNPRYITGGKGISRHAWGAAVDLNVGANPEGLESVQDPRLVEVMERWGLTSGHEWLVPDPGHFEYIGVPENQTG